VPSRINAAAAADDDDNNDDNNDNNGDNDAKMFVCRRACVLYADHKFVCDVLQMPLWSSA